ncbi:unnamed protein product [Calypogeia fissa]
MLGNFSFEDYFKEQACKWAWELATVEFKLPADRVLKNFTNLVFMQYSKLDDGTFKDLANKNIDTGLGLERLAQILQKVPNNYETELIYPILAHAAKLANKDYHTSTEKEKTYLKVIGVYARAATYLISDGVIPSNGGRGPCCKTSDSTPCPHGWQPWYEAEMKIQKEQSQLAHKVVKLTVGDATEDIFKKVPKSKFLGYETLQSSSSVVALLSKGVPIKEAIEGQEIELILEQTPFYAESGGQIGDNGTISGVLESGKVTLGAKVDALVDSGKWRRAMANHTATHLLQPALKKTLEDKVSQKGSLVAFDRLRFDFDRPRAMTEDELVTVENLINSWIGEAVDLDTKVMELADAKQSGAIAMFGERYDDQVRVLNVEGISKELCGGTHVRNTADIWGIKIITEQGIAAGVRRIEGVCGAAFIDYINQRDTVVKQLNSLLKAGKFLGPIARLTGGGGGGKPNFAQAGGKQPEKLDESLSVAKKDLIAALSTAS